MRAVINEVFSIPAIGDQQLMARGYGFVKQRVPRHSFVDGSAKGWLKVQFAFPFCARRDQAMGTAFIKAWV